MAADSSPVSPWPLHPTSGHLMRAVLLPIIPWQMDISNNRNDCLGGHPHPGFSPHPWENPRVHLSPPCFYVALDLLPGETFFCLLCEQYTLFHIHWCRHVTHPNTHKIPVNCRWWRYSHTLPVKVWSPVSSCSMNWLTNHPFCLPQGFCTCCFLCLQYSTIPTTPTLLSNQLDPLSLRKTWLPPARLDSFVRNSHRPFCTEITISGNYIRISRSLIIFLLPLDYQL